MSSENFNDFLTDSPVSLNSDEPLDFKPSGGTLAGTLAVSFVLILLFVIIATFLNYYSFKGMVKIGICEDRLLPFTLKSIANGMTGGLLGLVLYFTKK